MMSFYPPVQSLLFGMDHKTTNQSVLDSRTVLEKKLDDPLLYVNYNNSPYKLKGKKLIDYFINHIGVIGYYPTIIPYNYNGSIKTIKTPMYGDKTTRQRFGIEQIDRLKYILSTGNEKFSNDNLVANYKVVEPRNERFSWLNKIPNKY